MQRREAEPDARFTSAGCHLRWVEADVNTEFLEDVGSSGRGRGRAITVLDDGRARSCRDKRRHRRDVHRVGGVAPGADYVECNEVVLNAPSVLEHDGDE